MRFYLDENLSPSLPDKNVGAIAEALIAYAESHEGGVASYTVDYLRGPRPR